jgi:hypothetical protein
LWDDADNIWVYSGDLGTDFWLHENGKWIEQPTPPDGIPNILKEALNK